MKVMINHDNCQHGGAFSDRCLAATIRNPLGHERFCTALLEDDGQSDLTVVLVMDGQEHVLTLHTPEEIEAASAEGWVAFVEPHELVPG